MTLEGQDQISKKGIQEASLPSALSWLSCLGRPTVDAIDMWGGVEVRKHAGNVLIALLAALPQITSWACTGVCLFLCTRVYVHMDRGCKTSPSSCVESTVLHLSRTQI